MESSPYKNGRGQVWLHCVITAVFFEMVIPAAVLAANVLEEVIVTARQREEHLQKTPVAVSAISGAELQQSGMRNNLRHQKTGRGVRGAC
jgi:outer membrane receptor protein involved in Fe transport